MKATTSTSTSTGPTSPVEAVGGASTSTNLSGLLRVRKSQEKSGIGGPKSGKVESFQKVRKSQELEIQSQEKSGFGFLWTGDEKLKLI